MNKQECYQFLAGLNIEYDIVEHPAAFTVAEVEALALPEKESWAKNLFLRDDKRRNYYLLVLPDFKRADLKAFQDAIGSRRLRFASEDDLMKYLKLAKGHVTPLGLLNDKECAVQCYIDEYFKGRRIAVHPNENTASVYMNANDLVDIVKGHGNFIEYLEF